MFEQTRLLPIDTPTTSWFNFARNSTRIKKTLSKTFFFSYHFCIFAALSTIVIFYNQKYLFFGVDCQYLFSIAKNQQLFSHFAPYFTINPLEGNGNIWHPWNSFFSPGIIFGNFLQIEMLKPAIMHLFTAMELFASTYFLGRCLSFDHRVSLIAAWILPYLSCAYFPPALIYPQFILAPQQVSLVNAASLLIGLFTLTGRHSTYHTVICVLGMLITFFCIGICQPAHIILIVPVVTLFGIFSFFSIRNHQEIYIKLLTVFILLTFILTTGFIPFIAGLYLFTPITFFRQDFFVNDLFNDWFTISILFQSEVFGPAGILLIFTGLCGVLLSLQQKINKSIKFFGLGILVWLLLLLSGGIIVTKIPQIWPGPQVNYFEFCAWPFYTLFAAYFLVWFEERLSRRPVFSSVRIYNTFKQSLEFKFVFLILLLTQLWLIYHHESLTIYSSAIAFPPQKTDIIDLLEQKLAILPGSQFNGRVVNFASLPSESKSWDTQSKFDWLLSVKCANDHRLSGLWYFQIPTLMEYHSFTTPTFYLISRLFLTNPNDKTIRNALLLTKPDERILRLMGVKYFLTESPIQTEAKLVMSKSFDKDINLFLYELANVNTAGWSPTEYKLVAHAKEAISWMKDPQTDFQRIAIVQDPIPASLLPVTKSSMQVEKNGIHVTATSEGTSLLVIPFEYSRCIELFDQTSKMEEIRLIRANLTQIGILFSRNLDVKLKFKYGPFHNKYGRLKDADEMKKFHLPEALESP